MPLEILCCLWIFAKVCPVKDDTYDNAVAKSFFSYLKCELVHWRHYISRQQAQMDIFAYIETYLMRFVHLQPSVGLRQITL